MPLLKLEIDIITEKKIIIQVIDKNNLCQNVL